MSDRSGLPPARTQRRNVLPRWAGRTLLACTREHDWAAPPPQLGEPPAGFDSGLLLQAARWHRVTGCVHASLRGAGWLDPRALRELERSRGELVVRHLVGLGELSAMGSAFDASGIPWVSFKGPVLAGHFYRRPDLRTSVDVDVLVPPRRAGEAFRVLQTLGYRPAAADWCRLYAEGAGEVGLMSESGMNVDLHWQLISDAPTREQFSVPARQMIERRRELVVGDCRLPTFDAADTLLHLALHAAQGGGTRLVWFKDLERVLDVDRPDWDLVVRRAHEWRVGAAAAVMLARTKRLFPVAVPAEVLSALCGSRGWRLLDAAALRLAPVPRVTREASPARLLARAARGDGAASGRCLLRKTGLGLAYRARSGPRVAAPAADAQAQDRARTALFRTAARQD